jgi:hypothetical protein
MDSTKIEPGLCTGPRLRFVYNPGRAMEQWTNRTILPDGGCPGENMLHSVAVDCSIDRLLCGTTNSAVTSACLCIIQASVDRLDGDRILLFLLSIFSESYQPLLGLRELEVDDENTCWYSRGAWQANLAAQRRRSKGMSRRGAVVMQKRVALSLVLLLCLVPRVAGGQEVRALVASGRSATTPLFR